MPTEEKQAKRLQNFFYLLNKSSNDKFVEGFIWKEYIGAFLIALCSLAIWRVMTIEVPAVYHFPLYILFNISAIFGIMDITFFNYWKMIERNLKWWQTINGSTIFHLSIYIMLIIIGHHMIIV